MSQILINSQEHDNSAKAIQKLKANNLCPIRMDFYHHAGSVIDKFGNKIAASNQSLALSNGRRTPETPVVNG